MKKTRLSKFPISPLLAGGLLLLAAGGNVWADTNDTGSTPAQESNIENWDEDESEDGPGGNWTWFGMGYESRISSNQNSVAAGSRSSGVTAAGAGGAAAVMNQRGPGKGR
jgi:hypothetical protein